MKFKLVIFDNDGVLVDSEPLLKEAQVAAMAACGVTITEEFAYQSFHGLRLADVVRVTEAATGQKIDRQKYSEVYYPLAHELMAAKLKPCAGVVAVLEALRAKGVPYCVATGGALGGSYKKLAWAGLSGLIPNEVVFSAEQVARGKPAPDIMLFAAAQMGFAAEDCVVIEDAPFGLQAAKAAGMVAIGYLGGGHVPHTKGLDAARLIAEGADVVINRHEELLKKLGVN